MSILKELIEKLSKALGLWIEGMEIGRQTWKENDKLNKEIQEWELEESITQDKILFEFEWDFKHENT